MTKTHFISALAAVAAVSVALPAAAQSYGRPSHAQPSYGQPHRGPVASDYGWMSINARQANLDRRIDNGVRTGQLSRYEAMNVRSQFNGLVRLEAQYRRNGLSSWERADLNRRFDHLSTQIRVDRHDRNTRVNDRRDPVNGHRW
ncbi:hypothetical protein ASG17_04285 [Brevundimonas sp. Leaf363]|uniref:hypothetical protein n=1 Tax=Brevundimonas sp. Leaf363 TaxID=1736353 RepID=UPI0006F4325D|nr:hypothetical protein [Brevundimonas sp. Leaf363]KQS55318.1 hypothetical protein ASG17_04285 [Brevundimonas sp. Leaf363]